MAAKADAARWEQAEAPEETPELLAGTLPALRERVSASTGAAAAAAAAPDDVLLRFLRGSKYDPARAAERLEAYVVTREDLFPGQCADLSSPPVPDPECEAALSRAFVRVLPARDHAGRRLLLAMAARLDYSTGITPAGYARAVFVSIDGVLTEDTETQRHGITLMQDLVGVGRANFSRETIRRVLHVVQDCLPVRVGRLIICNQPMWFGWAFRIIKLFMKEKMRKRIVIIGAAYEALAEHVPLESTPTQLGGTLVVPDN